MATLPPGQIPSIPQNAYEGTVWSQLPSGMTPQQFALANGMPVSLMGSFNQAKHTGANPLEAVNNFLHPLANMNDADYASYAENAPKWGMIALPQGSQLRGYAGFATGDQSYIPGNYARNTTPNYQYAGYTPPTGVTVPGYTNGVMNGTTPNAGTSGNAGAVSNGQPIPSTRFIPPNGGNGIAWAGGNPNFRESGGGAGNVGGGGYPQPHGDNFNLGNGSGSGSTYPGGSQAGQALGSAGYPLDVQKYLDPSMKFTTDEGMRRLNSSASAAGQTFSGQTLKDILDYSQGQASTNWNNAAQRAAQQQGFKYGVDTGDRNFAYQAQLNDQTIPWWQQMQLANLGLQSQQSSGALAGTLAALLSGNLNTLGQTQGAGTIGANNSLTNAISQILANLNQNSLMNRIPGLNGTGGP